MNILGFFFFYYRIKVINAKKKFLKFCKEYFIFVGNSWLPKTTSKCNNQNEKNQIPNQCQFVNFKKFQTPDMQWSYDVKGVLPHYSPPRGKSAQPIAGPHPDPRMRGDKMNYIRENLRLTTTAVSSPIKGAPLLTRSMKLWCWFWD